MVLTLEVMCQLVDSFEDGVALTDGGGTIVLANRRLEEIFGYQHAELVGQRIERLIPAGLPEDYLGYQVTRAGARAAARSPATPREDAGVRLVGWRKDGTTFPALARLSSITSAAGSFALAVIGDVTRAGRLDDLAARSDADVTAEQARAGEVLDTVITGLFHVGLSLQTAADLPGRPDLPADAIRQPIAQAVQQLDDTIRLVRDAMFGRPEQAVPAPQGDRTGQFPRVLASESLAL